MRWLITVTLVSLLAALAASKPPNVLVRTPRLLARPLIKLAVQPALESAPVAVEPVAVEPVAVAPVAGPQDAVAPVASAASILPYVPQQFWPGYGAQGWYYDPYWSFGQMRPRRWGQRYWRPRVVVPVKASTVAPATGAGAGAGAGAETEIETEAESVPEVAASTGVVEATAQLA